MKVLYCIQSLQAGGGTERVLTTKANWLANNGHEVIIYIEDSCKTSFFDLDSGIRIISSSNCVGKQYFSDLKNLISDLDPDISIAVSGLAIKYLPKVKDRSAKILEFHYTKNFLVNFVKGLNKISFRRLHILKMHWLQFKLTKQASKFDKFVGLTQRDVNLWSNPKNMTYIYNPLSFKSNKKSDCHSKKIIAVGSWTPAKGMDQLLEAFGPIAHKYPEWHVDLFGSGQDESLLKDIIIKYDMEESVTLHNPVKDIHSRIIEASIYAFPSRSDGFGLVITEAMECGLPTVAMDCPCGPREILSDKTGIIVPDKDITAFRKALMKLMDDENLRIELGRNASEDVIRFYPDNIMQKWISLFDELKA